MMNLQHKLTELERKRPAVPTRGVVTSNIAPKTSRCCAAKHRIDARSLDRPTV